MKVKVEGVVGGWWAGKVDESGGRGCNYSPRREVECSSQTLYHLERVSFDPPVESRHVVKNPRGVVLQ